MQPLPLRLLFEAPKTRLHSMYLVETFGPERCMFVRPRIFKPISSACASWVQLVAQTKNRRRLKSLGGQESNFPPDNASCTYRTLWNAYKIMAKDLSPEAKNAVFHDTAVRVYKIGEARPAIGVRGKM